MVVVNMMQHARTMTMINSQYRTKSSKELEKMGCPAVVQVRCIKVYQRVSQRVYKEYHIDESTCPTANSLKMAKKKVLNQIKENRSKTTNSLSIVMRYYVKIPLCNIHKYHPLGTAATINHCVDKRVISKIYELVRKGVTRPDEVRRCVEEFVERDLFAHISPGERPKKTNRKYYPTREDLRNHVARAIASTSPVRTTKSHCGRR